MSAWLAAGFHGDMQYMAAHGLKRARPAELIPGTVSVITARMDYLPASTPAAPGEWQAMELRRLERPAEGIVSVYARGRDYHKVMRGRLQKLSERIGGQVAQLGHRAFTDSAPVLEAELAALPDFDERAGVTEQQLITLFTWSEEAFLRFTEGSPIRRIGHKRWLRNIAVAMGNALREAPADEAALRTSLQSRAGHEDDVVREHVLWALSQ